MFFIYRGYGWGVSLVWSSSVVRYSKRFWIFFVRRDFVKVFWFGGGGGGR